MHENDCRILKNCPIYNQKPPFESSGALHFRNLQFARFSCRQPLDAANSRNFPVVNMQCASILPLQCIRCTVQYIPQCQCSVLCTVCIQCMLPVIVQSNAISSKKKLHTMQFSMSNKTLLFLCMERTR